VPGSQPLPAFSLLTGNGGLNANMNRADGNAIYYIQTGQPGELAYYYQTNGYNSRNAVPLFANPDAIAADMLTNFFERQLQLPATGGAAPHAIGPQPDGELQLLEGSQRRRWRFAGALPEPAGHQQPTAGAVARQLRFDAHDQGQRFLELPFGKDHRLHYKPLDRAIGGWTVGAVMTWQSGAPFSITSGYGTLNRAARSYYNTADTTLAGQALFHAVSFHMTGKRADDGSVIRRQPGGRLRRDFRHRRDAVLGRALLQPAGRKPGNPAKAHVRRSLDVRFGSEPAEGRSKSRAIIR